MPIAMVFALPLVTQPLAMLNRIVRAMTQVSNQGHFYDQLQAAREEQQRLKIALHHAEATNRALATIPDLLIRMKRDGTYLEFIPAKTFKTVMPQGNMRGVNIFNVMPLHIAQERMQYVEQALATGEIQVYEYLLEIDDICQVQEARIAVSGENEVLVVVRDITQRRQMEQERDRLLQELEQHNQNLEGLVAQRTAELVKVNQQLRAEINERQQIEIALRESAERFSRVFEEAPIGMSVHDRRGNVIQVNPALCQMLNYSEAELKKLSFLQYTPSDDLAIEMPYIEQCTQGDINSYTLEKHYIKKTGDLLWVNLTAFVLRDQQGEVIYRLAMVEDISDRKRIEAEQHRADAELQASLAEKNILLQEIHHRVKNNLQTVSSLLKLQAGSIQDPRVIAPLKESQNRVRSMALIHEKLYQSPSLSQVDFADYIRKFAAELMHSYNGKARSIDIKTEVDELELGVDSAIPCGLIMNELVSNAFKYAFPEGRSGTICIQLRSPLAGTYMMTVQDNGIPLPADFDLHRPKSLGFQIVAALTRQIHGTLSLDQSNGKAFSITFTSADVHPHLTYK